MNCYNESKRSDSGHLNDDIAKGTLNSILKQAGLKEVEADV